MTKRVLLGVVAIGLVACAAYASFYIAPEERTMGAIQKIFYFHASTAWAGETTFFVCFLANLLYIWKRKPQFDWLGVTCAEVGAACITVVLITGPIWARPVWGIWWTWDARLTSTFVLWILYICYLLLRTLVDEPDRRALMSALFGDAISRDVMSSAFPQPAEEAPARYVRVFLRALGVSSVRRISKPTAAAGD